jgi:hypothetical protein
MKPIQPPLRFGNRFLEVAKLQEGLLLPHIPHPQLSHGQDLRRSDHFDPSGRDPIE